MAYISTQRVKEIRNELKATFPEIKFSVVTRHYSSINVTILSSPYDFFSMLKSTDSYGRPVEKPKNEVGVNQYYIADHWEGKAKEILLKIKDIVFKGQYDRNAGDPTADYPDCNFYGSISIGQWDRPYQIVEKTTTKKTKKHFPKKDFTPVNLVSDIYTVN